MALARTATVGAPGVFVVPPEPIREVTGVRRDIAAFFGVAPRGPAREPPIDQLQPDDDIATWLRTTAVRRSLPVRISSWDEYQLHFGGYEGAGRLPYAVSAFFAQGGQEAYVVRVVEERDGNPLDGRASSLLGDLATGSGIPVRMHARSEGSWGNRLRAELTFATRAIEPLVPAQPGDRHLWVDEFEYVPVGSLLLLRTTSGADALTYVDQSLTKLSPTGSTERRLTLLDEVGSDLASVDVVAGTLDVVDLDPTYDRRDRLDEIGFHPAHPRFLARVVVEESTLLWPATDWPAEAFHIDDTELRPRVLAMPGAGAVPRGWLRPLRVANGTKIVLEARDDRRWDSDPIRGRATLSARQITVRDVDGSQLVVDSDRALLPEGSLLRLTRPDGGWFHRYAASVSKTSGPGGVGVRWRLDTGRKNLGEIERAEIVTMSLEVTDGKTTNESWKDLGLHPSHPRWIPTVIDTESRLVQSMEAWRDDALLLDRCPACAEATIPDDDDQIRGVDRWGRITPRDFWDPEWVPGNEEPGSGVHAIALLDDVGLVVTPDLYDPLPLDPPACADDAVERCGAEFGPHEPGTPPPPLVVEPPALEALRRDPRVPADLDDIVTAQSALVEFAEQQQAWTLLLDVPLGLEDRRIRRWRSLFDSAFAAAYHPWLDTAVAGDARDSLITMNPSAFAAGIMANRELRFGVQQGPANEIAVDAVRPTTVVSPEQHDDLHPAGINVFLPERDGVRLTAARTLSRRRSLRQLNVARLMTVIRLSLEREMAWTVFEPNNQALWAEVRRMVTSFLERLYEAGAFAGTTTQEAFFVRCDHTTMTKNDLDNGRMRCDVGVAPSEPLEYVDVILEHDSGLLIGTVG